MFQSTPSGGKATSAASLRALISPSFQSTPSGGKATDWVERCVLYRTVSIHAFRGEGDRIRMRRIRLRMRFNPRLPGGRRRKSRIISTSRALFQSTPSGGKATPVAAQRRSARLVSIHAFRGEGDVCRLRALDGRLVSIHAFRGEGDF